MKNIVYAVLACAVLAAGVAAQKSKPWDEWSKKDADKILNDSPWGQSQSKGEAPGGMPQTKDAGKTQNEGPGRYVTPTNYYIRYRLLSAKPIREAFARRLVLANPGKATDLQGQLQAAVDQGFGDFIIVAVNFEAPEPKTVAQFIQGLARLNTAALTGKAYLERKDGKRIELTEYRPPTADDTGGKFIFPRTLDGSPFLVSDSGTIRFVVNISDRFKLDAKFKVSDMMYGEKLEY
jgi:hypothetical protein